MTAPPDPARELQEALAATESADWQLAAKNSGEGTGARRAIVEAALAAAARARYETGAAFLREAALAAGPGPVLEGWPRAVPWVC